MNGFRPATARRLIHEQNFEIRRARAIAAWVDQASAGDHALGRSGANWAEDPAIGIKRTAKALAEKGVVAYVGAGQLILVDTSHEVPLIMQRRPLAQRELFLKIDEE